ncbi:hypothetical protein HanIR_Chr06g0277021 [Helianthus annuus]|nr:hypothetical protein HanIR_Chr06g0277021 [Helianthus annuus]
MVVGGGGECRWRLVAALGDNCHGPRPGLTRFRSRGTEILRDSCYNNGGGWVAAATVAVGVRWWRVATMASVVGVGGGGLWRRWWVVVLLMNGARGDGMKKTWGLDGMILRERNG